jgi:hypothetical protein
MPLSHLTDLELPLQKVETAEDLKQKDKDIKYNNYLIRHKARIDQWNTAHADKSGQSPKPPIYWDTEYNDFVWMNRDVRRQR